MALIWPKHGPNMVLLIGNNMSLGPISLNPESFISLVRDVHALANRAIISEFDYFVAKFANLVCLNKFFFDVSVNLSISQLVNLSISQLVN